eukprot:g14933.t1
MGPFEDLARVAYVASWIDCLFPKGVAQNGVKPDGSKSIADMHSAFKCLRMKGQVSGRPMPTMQAGSSRRHVLDHWAETTRLISFDDIPAEDVRFASLTEFRDSCEMLFEIPEIRRACFENRVAFNAINGENYRLHSQIGLPLPVREQLDGEKGVAFLNFEQLTSFVK